MSGKYTFGDSDLAARRLELVADVFEPASRALLASIPTGPAVALDLGCGPGFATRLLADECQPTLTIGLDSSERFVGLARERFGQSHLQFAVHDVTQTPLPHAPVDALYARLLLAHLPAPLSHVARWREALRPGGVLVLDEIESIEAPRGPLRDYEDLVVRLVASEGACMYAGPLLEPLGGSCVELLVEVSQAARMFGMNLATWGDEARRRRLATAADLERLADDLRRLQRGSDRPTVKWVLRQLVLES